MMRANLVRGITTSCMALSLTALAMAAGPRVDQVPAGAVDSIEVIAIEAAARELPPVAEQIADHEVGRGLKNGRVSVLVYMDPVQGPNVKANVRAFAAANQGVVRYEYDTVLPDVVNLRNIPEGKLNALAAMPGVKRVEEDVYHPEVVRLHDSIPLIRGLQSQITGAGYSADGAGVRICVADTGIDSDHIMFSTRIDASAGYDFYNNDPNPEDDHGHGSHCSGIALGGTGLSWDPCGTGSMPFQGVAPEATLIGAKILNQFGGGFDSDIIAGINHCADQSPSGGRADIISMSIGTGNYSGPCTHSWAVAANNAAANGVVAIAASGNDNNSNSMSSPACGADVIAVGMTWKNDYPTCEDPTTNWNWGVCTDFAPQTDDVGCFSNESDYLDVTAPGANIWSASISAGGSSITGSSGTSMSCPTVAGLAALVLDLDPSLTPAEVRQIIRDGAIDLGPAGFDRAYGWGRIDVLNTLALVGPQCTVNGDCDDGDVCNGAETCNAGSCQSGTPLNCDDGDACTTDGCNAVSGCFYNPVDCDDSDPCTNDSCDIVSGCINDPITCPPGEECSGGVCVPQVCNNNGTCDSGEDCNNCSGDCISGSLPGYECGNGLCEAGDGEDCVNCPADCNGITTGRPSGRFCCGATEGCGDSRCTTGGYSCTTTPSGGGGTYCCGDLVCEGDESSANCEIDCGPAPFCGDGNCDPGEDECNCAADCGAPAGSEISCTDGIDNDCDSFTDCDDSECATDPACTCGAKGDSCTTGADCCSGACKNNGTCR